jgi:hypothetical protein
MTRFMSPETIERPLIGFSSRPSRLRGLIKIQFTAKDAKKCMKTWRINFGVTVGRGALLQAGTDKP